MKCRVETCDRIEWMGRQLCAPHLKMLPDTLYHGIRRAVNGKVRSDELPALIDQALAIIAEKEAEHRVTAEIEIFRTHMATVYGAIAGIRTIPMGDVRDQLAASSEALLRTNPELHADRKPRIDRDLAFLDYFAEVRVKLGEIIEAYPVPMPASPAEVTE